MSKKNKKKDAIVSELLSGNTEIGMSYAMNTTTGSESGFFGEPEPKKSSIEKKDRTPTQIVFDLLMSKVNNPELQNRYNSMEKNAKAYKEEYNEYVKQYNVLIAKKTKLAEILLEGARMGIINPDAMLFDKCVDEDLAKIIPRIEEAKKCFENDERLMEKYRELTHNELFNFWEVLKALEKDFASWSTFKVSFDNKIF